MAFSKGQVSTEQGSAKRYIGLAHVHVLAVNPTKAELEKIYGASQEKEPEYLSTMTVGDDNHEVPTARVDFIVKTDADSNQGIDIITKVTFFLRQEGRYNSDKSKMQVIDKYGRTAWVTPEQLKNHDIPLYNNGYANIDKDYRPAYRGEEDLTKFLTTYLNIPNVMTYNNETKTWTMRENTEDCEARLDQIASYFKGNFSELKGLLTLQPNNKLCILIGIRTTENNNIFHDVYNRMFLRNNASSYDRLEADVLSAKNNGAYPNTEFVFEPLREYKIEPTVISPSTGDNNDFFI